MSLPLPSIPFKGLAVRCASLMPSFARLFAAEIELCEKAVKMLLVHMLHMLIGANRTLPITQREDRWNPVWAAHPY